MEIMNVLTLISHLALILSIKADENSNIAGTQCADYQGKPKMCYPPFQNHASGGLKVTATNTCGLTRRQKYCIGLSSAEMRTRCAYCDNSNPGERHSADYLTDHNITNWWQSETLANNKIIHYEQSINLTIDLGKQFHVTFIHIQFKSPRPRAMVIYRKYNDDQPWSPWLYLASNCKTYFNMSYDKNRIIQRFDDVLCTEEFSSLNDFYNGVVMFGTIFGRPGADDFFNNKKMMDWTTASQIRIELKKMQTFGDQNAENELLMTYFYAIKSIQIAARCWCNGHGNECRRSTGEGIEPKLFCVCHPSHHTTGQSCEKCDNFYQDRPWQMATANNPNACKSCNCNGNSESCIFSEELYIKSGNISGGFCLNCLSNTKGPHCDECLDGFYKDPLNPTRCIPCNCNPVGRETVNCDVTGKCLCHPGVDGDKCTRCKGDHYNFGPFGCQPCNCELAGINATDRLQCNPSTGVCYCKKNVIGEKCDSCVQGYFSLSSDDPLGCRPCFCFAHTKECTIASGFVLTKIESKFHSNVDDWKYGIGQDKAIYTPMLDAAVYPPAITWFQNREPWLNNYFLWAPGKFLGNQRLSYNYRLELTMSFTLKPDHKALDSKLVSMINDVELVSDMMSATVPFDAENNPYPDAGKGPQVYRFILNEESGQWRDRIDHFRFISILSNLVGIRVRLTNPSGFAKLHKVTLYTAIRNDSVEALNTKLPPTTNIEKCSCPPQYTGLSCENCATGYHRASTGSEFILCIKCSCNNQSDTCDVITGKCDCQYHSTGHNCERCSVGYYGDPTTMIRNVCKPCGCPGGTACELVKMADGNKVVCIDCPDNLGGYRCNRCRDNYFGNPNLNIPCQQCDCHGNIDYLNSCDFITGKCTNCLYNSAGDHCETCKPGYQLLHNENSPNRCKKCACNSFGSVGKSVNCNVNTGQCQCHPFVIGRNCDACKPGFFNLTSIIACEECKCFIPGSVNHTCDLTSGQCFCKPGVVGINCDRCESGYFNLSQTGCQKCLCDVFGSTSQDCNVITGECRCKKNIIGSKCDSCIENHHNITGGCPNCPPCYTLLQSRITALKTDINNIILNTNIMNGSDLRYANVSGIIDLAKSLNRTVNTMFEWVLTNFTKIKSYPEELDKSRKLVTALNTDIVDLKKTKNNERLNTIIDDIKTLKKKVETIIDEAFAVKLKRLQSYISDKSITDSNITKMAEMARTSLNEVNKAKSTILNQIINTEKDLNNSLIYFIELITTYYKFMNKSDEFDLPGLEKLSSDVTTEGQTNLDIIKDLDRRHSLLDGLFNTTDLKMKNISSSIDKLVKELDDIARNARYYEKRLTDIMLTLPDVKKLENTIMTKSNVNMALTKNMTDLRNLRNTLDEAQQNITDAINKAQQILSKLQGIGKDFDDVVNKSKLEATKNMNKLPQLKSELEKMEIDIQVLRYSSSDIIKEMQFAYNYSLDVLSQTKELELKFTNLLSKTLELKTKSSNDAKLSSTIKTTAEKRLQDDSLIEKELKSITNLLQKTRSINKNQTDSTDALEKVLSNIEKQLKQIEDQSQTMSDEKIDVFTKMIDSISLDVTDYEKTQIGILTTEMELMNDEWRAVNKEIDETDAEIKRLELIKNYMLGDTGCHRSGGKVER